MRGGFTTVAEYGRDINAAFQDYYFNTARNLSADSITRIGFTDENVRHIPYARGSLYFADLDSKIRAHSRGSRNLDMVMRELFERRQRGVPLNHAVWIETVTREAGASAADEFDQLIIRGTATLVPASDAFGRCFQRRPTPRTTVNGQDRPPAFEWVRVEAIPEDECRKP
jgi:predicted metalloprotease with PDZ domain